MHNEMVWTCSDMIIGILMDGFNGVFEIPLWCETKVNI